MTDGDSYCSGDRMFGLETIAKHSGEGAIRDLHAIRLEC